MSYSAALTITLVGIHFLNIPYLVPETPVIQKSDRSAALSCAVVNARLMSVPTPVSTFVFKLNRLLGRSRPHLEKTHRGWIQLRQNIRHLLRQMLYIQVGFLMTTAPVLIPRRLSRGHFGWDKLQDDLTRLSQSPIRELRHDTNDAYDFSGEEKVAQVTISICRSIAVFNRATGQARFIHLVPQIDEVLQNPSANGSERVHLIFEHLKYQLGSLRGPDWRILVILPETPSEFLRDQLGEQDVILFGESKLKEFFETVGIHPWQVIYENGWREHRVVMQRDGTVDIRNGDIGGTQFFGNFEQRHRRFHLSNPGLSFRSYESLTHPPSADLASAA